MSRPVVLIADDSMVVRSFLRKQLVTEDLELAEADGGDAVLEKCRSANPPDVVLLDVEMPGMSGYDVLTALQADPATSGIPVIFLSGRVGASDVAQGLRLGAHDYLRKPVETGELIARVTHALRTKQMYDKLQQEKAPAEEGGEPAATTVDATTGVLDLQGVQATFRELALAVRNGRRLAAVLLEVDDLATMHAQHGGGATDQILRAVATVLTERVGPRDVVGRTAPDQFIVLMPDAVIGEAQALALRVRDAVINSPALGAGAFGVRVDIGAAATDSDLEALLADLEGDLAKAKAEPAPVPVADALPEPPPYRPSTPPPSRPTAPPPGPPAGFGPPPDDAVTPPAPPRPAPKPADPPAPAPAPAKDAPAATATPDEPTRPIDDDITARPSQKLRRWMRSPK